MTISSLNLMQLSMLSNLSTMAILVDHMFFDAYAGESRDWSCAAKFCTGDTVSMSSAAFPGAGDVSDVSYACLALFKSSFQKMEGVRSGVCLKCQTKPSIASFYVWKSLQYCYSWILSSDQRKSLLPYFESVSIDIKYDIFRVVYVSGDSEPKFQFFYPRQMLEQRAGGESKDEGKLVHSASII